jgi:hypothetical protein
MADPPPKFPRPGALPAVETLASMKAVDPRQERRDSIGALDDNDRALLNRVLTTAKQAIEGSKADREQMQKAIEAEARERAMLEGKMVSRFSDYDVQITNIKEDVGELKGLRGDISGLRGDISGLTSAVTANLAEDARRERDHGALVIRVEALANDVGRASGKAAGARSGRLWGLLTGTSGPIVFAFLIWLITTVINAMSGKPPPPMPSLTPAPPASEVSAPASSAH